MLPKTSQLPSIPEDTKRVAEAAFKKGNICVDLQKHIGNLFEDNDFIELYPKMGKPSIPPWRLATVLILQYMEGATDRRAAEFVRSRIDWKYVLRLPLDDPGFAHTALTKFRKRMVENDKERLIFDCILEKLGTTGLLEENGPQRTDSTHILGAIRTLNRIECVGEALRSVLNAIAVVDIAWLRKYIPKDWFERYEHSFSDYHLPKDTEKREKLAHQLGKDGFQILSWLNTSDEGEYLSRIPSVKTLEKILEQNYEKKKR